MTIGSNIWMICLKLNWFSYGLSRMLQISQFVWTPCYSIWDVFNNFLLIDSTDRRKISSDQKRFFIALSLYPLSFFANTPFKFIGTSYKPHHIISTLIYHLRSSSRVNQLSGYRIDGSILKRLAVITLFNMSKIFNI